MAYFYNARPVGIPAATNTGERACLHVDTPRLADISRTLATGSPSAQQFATRLGLRLLTGRRSSPNWTGFGSGKKSHTREGDAIAAARRRLPMVEVDPRTPLIGADGPVPLIAIFGRQAGVLGGLARVLAAAVGHERGTVSARRPPDRPVVTHQGRTPRRPRLLCK
jgi:hypothetical protein